MSVKESKIVKVIFNENKRKIVLPSTYKFLCIKLQQGFDIEGKKIKLLIKEKNIEIKDEQSYAEKIKELDANDIIIIIIDNDEIQCKFEKFIEHLKNFGKIRWFKSIIYKFSYSILSVKPKKFQNIENEKNISFQFNTLNETKNNNNSIPLSNKSSYAISKINVNYVNSNFNKNKTKETNNNTFLRANNFTQVRDREKVVPKVPIPQEHSLNQDLLDKFINEIDECFMIKVRYENSTLKKIKESKTKEEILAILEKENYISLNNYPKDAFKLKYKFVEEKKA